MRAAVLFCLALLACTPARRDEGDDTCDTPCGTACCALGEACLDGACTACERQTCAGLGLGCGPASDGCGGSLDCGACAGDLTCGGGGKAGKCGKPGCTAETDAELCQAQGRNCGSLDVRDACGTNRHVAACGTCTNPATCGGSGKAGVCGQPGETCVPETDRQLCTRLGHDCGPLEAFDNCDASRQVVSCGSCAAPKTCGGGGRDGACGCTGESDQALCQAKGAQCGSITVKDRCDVTRTIACGNCSAPNTCGGGAANKCGCTAESDPELCATNHAECGTISVKDRCNRTRSLACGTCTSPASCGGGGTANRCGCSGETDQILCQRKGAFCGALTTTDSCGLTRRITSCGSCTAPESCGGGGTANVCGCTSHKTDAQLCTDQGYECGSGSFTDECGVTRDVPSCGTCVAPKECGMDWWSANTCTCPAESDQELCTRASYQCGSLTTTDHCGNARTIDCGTCDSAHTCNAQHACFCAPESDAQLCARVGSDCGSRTFTDNCGTSRTVNCGSCGTGLTCPTQGGIRCTAWTKVASPTSNDIGGLWGVSANEIYAVSDSESSANPRALYWNGTAWAAGSRITVTGLTLDRLTDVYAVKDGSNTVIFLAASGKDTAGTRWGVVLKSVGWTTSGTGWTVATKQQGTFWNVRGTSATNVFAAMPGLSTTPPVPPRLLRYDGSTWTDVPLGSSVTPTTDIQGLMPFSASEVYFSANSGAFLWRWNGTAVSQYATPSTGYFDIWGASANDIWMTGIEGQLAQWNGTTVVDRTIANSHAWIYDVHGTAANDVWFAGTDAFIGHWDGSQIVREYSPTNGWNNAVFANTTDVWVTGTSGSILRRKR